MSWSNWSGSVTCQPQTIAAPTSEAELIALVEQAAARQSVRVVGTGHSFVPLCASTGLLLTTDALQGIVSLNPSALQATVWGGTKLHQLGEPLLAAGMAMKTMGDIDRQSIAGAISTGTHGTGPHLGSLSTQVVGLRLVTATGDVLECSPAKDAAVFKAAQVSLGMLGIISQVTLQLLPAYRLHEKTDPMPFEVCMAQLDDLIAANRHFEFFWLPQDDVCAVKTLNPTTAEPETAAGSPPSTSSEAIARYLNQERIDYSPRIIPSTRDIRFNEMEFAVPAEVGPECLREVRQLMQTTFPAVKWPVEYRTLAADDIYLSPAYGRETVTISIHQAYDLPYQEFFNAAEAIFRRYQGRPHWGKHHSYTGPELQASYPMWEPFQAIRRRLDPDGRFLNHYLRSIFMG